MKKLIDIVFAELSKKDIIPDNEKYQLIESISNSIENWLIEEYTPEVLRFEYWAHKEFPKTFKSKFINKEDDKNIEDAEYEEIDTDD